MHPSSKTAAAEKPRVHRPVIAAVPDPMTVRGRPLPMRPVAVATGAVIATPQVLLVPPPTIVHEAVVVPGPSTPPPDPSIKVDAERSVAPPMLDTPVGAPLVPVAVSKPIETARLPSVAAAVPSERPTPPQLTMSVAMNQTTSPESDAPLGGALRPHVTALDSGWPPPLDIISALILATPPRH